MCIRDRYTGSWLIKDGVQLRQGHGVYADGTQEGQTYEGEWANDAMDGRGTFNYASGAKYVGEFVANKYNGYGTFTFADGSVYEGNFKVSLRLYLRATPPHSPPTPARRARPSRRTRCTGRARSPTRRASRGRASSITGRAPASATEPWWPSD